MWGANGLAPSQEGIIYIFLASSFVIHSGQAHVLVEKIKTKLTMVSTHNQTQNVNTVNSRPTQLLANMQESLFLICMEHCLGRMFQLFIDCNRIDPGGFHAFYLCNQWLKNI